MHCKLQVTFLAWPFLVQQASAESSSSSSSSSSPSAGSGSGSRTKEAGGGGGGDSAVRTELAQLLKEHQVCMSVCVCVCARVCYELDRKKWSVPGSSSQAEAVQLHRRLCGWIVHSTHAAIKQSGSDHGRPSRGCAAAHEAVLIVCPFCTCKQRGSKHVVIRGGQAEAVQLVDSLLVRGSLFQCKI
eukprot:171808-Pelagomonas_calceolata.AAC.3